MNTFNRKSLHAALAGLGALGATGAAQAVNVNPDGLGQVLIYPYYTTQGTNAPYNSLLSVVNSTNSGKVVKVRFLEGKNSIEVLDFNLWLSPKDVWTAAIVPSGVGAGIATADLSCTTPKVSASAGAPTNFVNFAYVGDPATQTLDRTKEGYVEIIEMGNVTGATLAAITHAQPSPPGVPPGCASLPVGATPPTDLVVGNGGLFGGISLINPLAGGDVTADAVALNSFTATTLWNAAGSPGPNLNQVNPRLSVVFNNTEVVTTDWSASSNNVDAVSAALMHDNVYNEFVLDPGTKSGTDWVLTFPTKRFYYNAFFNVTKLFQNNFRATGACDDILLTQYNREEQTVVNVPGFSPPSPTGTDAICWEANVISFNNTNVLLATNKSVLTTSFPNGWVSLNFFPATITPPVHQLIGGGAVRVSTATGAPVVGSPFASSTYNGLPVVGFSAQLFNNGTLVNPAGGSIQAFYTGSFIHKYTRLITAP